MGLEKDAAHLTLHRTGRSYQLVVHRVAFDEYYTIPRKPLEDLVDTARGKGDPKFKRVRVSFAKIIGNYNENREEQT